MISNYIKLVRIANNDPQVICKKIIQQNSFDTDLQNTSLIDLLKHIANTDCKNINLKPFDTPIESEYMNLFKKNINTSNTYNINSLINKDCINNHPELYTFGSFESFIQLYSFVDINENLVFVIRESDSITDWKYNIKISQVSLNLLLDQITQVDDSIKIHNGFCSAFQLKDDLTKSSLKNYILNIVNKYHDLQLKGSIIICGHSLGSAIGQLCYVLVRNYMNIVSCTNELKLYMSGSPMVGNAEYVNYFQTLSDSDYVNLARFGDVVVGRFPFTNYKSLKWQMITNDNQKIYEDKEINNNFFYKFYRFGLSILVRINYKLGYRIKNLFEQHDILCYFIDIQ